MTVSSINLKISNNPGRSTVAGKGSGGRGKRAAAEKSAGTAASRARAGISYAAALSAPAPNVTPVKQAKRQDQKATPTSHATTKATEMAGRKKSTATRGTDPISLLSSGPGGGSQAPTPVDRKDLASSSKALFPGNEGGKKKVPPKSFLDYGTEDEALAAALAEVTATRATGSVPKGKRERKGRRSVVSASSVEVEDNVDEISPAASLAVTPVPSSGSFEEIEADGSMRSGQMGTLAE